MQFPCTIVLLPFRNLYQKYRSFRDISDANVRKRWYYKRVDFTFPRYFVSVFCKSSHCSKLHHKSKQQWLHQWFRLPSGSSISFFHVLLILLSFTFKIILCQLLPYLLLYLLFYEHVVSYLHVTNQSGNTRLFHLCWISSPHFIHYENLWIVEKPHVSHLNMNFHFCTFIKFRKVDLLWWLTDYISL